MKLVLAAKRNDEVSQKKSLTKLWNNESMKPIFEIEKLIILYYSHHVSII